MCEEKLRQFKKVLKIKYPILGIYFLNSIPLRAKHYQDTACTALVRSFLKNETVFFGAKSHQQLCSGANYFLKLSKTNYNEALDVYIRQEHVMKNKNIGRKFLKSLPKFPDYIRNKFIVINPFRANNKPKIIVLLLTPAQAGRIIGLLNYADYKEIKISPNQSTCMAFFAPLATGLPHINFIDYYDRYHQGRIAGKNIWPEDKMIVSLSFKQFKDVLYNFNKSPQGSYKPNMKLKIVDNI